MTKKFRFFSILLLYLLSFTLGCKSPHTKKIEQAQLNTAKRFVELVANYTPKTAESRFLEAKNMLSGSIKKSFGEGILGAELAAIKAVGRSQTFEISTSETELVHISDFESIAGYIGYRVRKVGDKTGAPIELSYQVTLEPNQDTSEGDKEISFVVTDIQVQLSEGQDKALSEEKLLEKFNEAADAAREERKKFVEAVNMVSEDLKAHEKKVEEDFNRLSTSLDKLGGTVRKLKDETEAMHKKRVEKILEARKKAKEEKEAELKPTPVSEEEEKEEES